MEIMKIENCHKSFGSSEILKGVSFSVDKGEVICLIGPSGNGKTTLLNCCCMLEEMDEGILSYGDEIACQKENGKTLCIADEVVRRKSSLVFQNFNLFPHMTVLQNLTDAPIRVLKKKRNEAEEKARELLEKMHLSDKADFYPYQLSGGQKQRIAIARALAMEPEVLFFDEPTSALDPQLTQEVLEVIRELANEKMTMVIVTHEMAFARNIANRILFMLDGQIIEQGSSQQLFDNPKDPRTAAFLSAGANQ